MINNISVQALDWTAMLSLKIAFTQQNSAINANTIGLDKHVDILSEIIWHH